MLYCLLPCPIVMQTDLHKSRCPLARTGRNENGQKEWLPGLVVVVVVVLVRLLASDREQDHLTRLATLDTHGSSKAKKIKKVLPSDFSPLVTMI